MLQNSLRRAALSLRGAAASPAALLQQQPAALPLLPLLCQARLLHASRPTRGIEEFVDDRKPGDYPRAGVPLSRPL
jgi:hypothetical protein